MTAESWKAYREAVIAQIDDFAIIFGDLAKAKVSGDWVQACCPLHDDKNPSFGYNRKTGRWACFAGCGKGGPIDFIMQTSGQSFLDALISIGDRLGVPRPAGPRSEKPPIPENLVQSWHHALMADPEALRWLREHRGLTDETIAKHEIGWEPRRQRFAIPVRDEKGNVMNVRLYSSTKDPKMINYADGNLRYGSPPRLYGIDKLPKDDRRQVIICEGEWDRLLLDQEGFLAVTGTHGCSVFRPDWLPAFKGRDVAIMLDVDPEGRKAAAALLEAFRTAEAASVRDIVLPLKGSKDDKDVTDYLHRRGLQTADLQRLIEETKPHVYADQDSQEEPLDLESFLEVERTDIIDRRVRVPITVCGETSEAFHAVEEFKVTSCPRMSKGGCFQCRGTAGAARLPRGAREYIGSCMSSDIQVKAMLREHACRHGQKPAIDILFSTTVKEFFCHQLVNRVSQVQDAEGQTVQLVDGRRQELLEKRVYYLSSDHPRPGNYLATGWIKSHPKTQQVTMLIDRLDPLEDDLESFSVKEARPLLQELKDLGFESMFKDLIENVTRVYERDEILLAALLTYCSPRWIKFNGEITRGWLVSLILGDSGSGKTQTCQRLSDFVAAGDSMSGLTGSRTGLAYALVEHSQKGWQVRVGRYPANNGKLLMVDEVQHLLEFDLRAISKAMEEGFLQIDRVQSRGYECQTRLILVANPRRDRVMDSFAFGCESLKTLLPPTVVRRTDLAVFANAGDLKDLSVINRTVSAGAAASRVKASALRALIFWAWRLRPDQVTFSPEAEAEVLAQAKTLTERFGWAPDVPLVTLSDFRKKLARTAAAWAVMTLSTPDDFETVRVESAHVTAAAGFFSALYSHDNCSLDDYSDIQRRSAQLTDYDPIADHVRDRVRNAAHATDPSDRGSFQRILYALRINDRIRRDDLSELAGVTPEEVSRTVRPLKRFNLVTSSKDGYSKLPKFNKFVRRFLRDNPEFFDGVLDGGNRSGKSSSSDHPDASEEHPFQTGSVIGSNRPKTHEYPEDSE